LLDTDRGGALLATLVGVLSAVVNVAPGSSGTVLGAVANGLLMAATTAGAYAVPKKLFAPSDAPPASPPVPLKG
jgi:hypothetical protein